MAGMIVGGGSVEFQRMCPMNFFAIREGYFFRKNGHGVVCGVFGADGWTGMHAKWWERKGGVFFGGRFNQNYVP